MAFGDREMRVFFSSEDATDYFPSTFFSFYLSRFYQMGYSSFRRFPPWRVINRLKTYKQQINKQNQ